MTDRLMTECPECEGYGLTWPSTCPKTCGDPDHTGPCDACNGKGEVPAPERVCGTCGESEFGDPAYTAACRAHTSDNMVEV